MALGAFVVAPIILILIVKLSRLRSLSKVYYVFVALQDFQPYSVALPTCDLAIPALQY